MQTDGDSQSRSSEKITLNSAGVTLYERLGGYDGLNQLVKSFYAKARYDPILGEQEAAEVSGLAHRIGEDLEGMITRRTRGPLRH